MMDEMEGMDDAEGGKVIIEVDDPVMASLLIKKFNMLADKFGLPPHPPLDRSVKELPDPLIKGLMMLAEAVQDAQLDGVDVPSVNLADSRGLTEVFAAVKDLSEDREFLAWLSEQVPGDGEEEDSMGEMESAPQTEVGMLADLKSKRGK